MDNQPDYGIVTWTRLPTPTRHEFDAWAKSEERTTASQLRYLVEKALAERRAAEQPKKATK